MLIKQRHQDYINPLKANEHAVIGYYRKSKTRNNEGQVIKSLSGMVLGLQERSLVDETFVSVSCNAGTPINKHDMKKNSVVDKLPGVSGTAQGMISNVL